MCYACVMAPRPGGKPKTIVTCRIDPDDLAELDRLGNEAKPVPASRSEMIGVAVREYVERHGRKAKGGK